MVQDAPLNPILQPSENVQQQIDSIAHVLPSVLKELSNLSYQMASTNGFWEDATFGDKIALVHAELSEALEEYRDHGLDQNKLLYFENDKRNLPKPEGIAAELADTVIRICDMCGRYNINLAYAILLKLTYNATREFKHGGKKI